MHINPLRLKSHHHQFVFETKQTNKQKKRPFSSHSEWQRGQHPYPPEHYQYNYGNYPMKEDHRYDLPPKLPPKSLRKKLKVPLMAIKNALIKSTKQLRRQNSMIEDKPQKPGSGLRRQHSMLEQRSSERYRAPDYQQYPPQQQQYYENNRERERGRERPYDERSQYYDDQRGDYVNRPPHQYDGYDDRSRDYYDHGQENLYANRALIEFERKANENASRVQQHTNTGTRIVRRHSMADRTNRAPSRMALKRPEYDDDPDRIEREEIYQTRSGAYMMQQTNAPPPHGRPPRPSSAQRTTHSKEEEAIYQSRRDMHLDHLYQSKKEMQQRIYMSRMEVERSTESESPSASSSSATTPIQSDHVPPQQPEFVYQSRRELKERGFKTRTQLRDAIYQTRRETMETMAEPRMGSTKKVEFQQHQEPIYEAKEPEPMPEQMEHRNPITPLIEDVAVRISPQTHRIQNRLITPIIANQNSCNSSGFDDEDTINSANQSEVHKTVVAADTFKANETKAPLASDEVAEFPIKAMSPRTDRAHLSNIMRRVAPSPKPGQQQPQEKAIGGLPDNCHASRTSMETHYTSSQMSIGPPNAQSTPYASEHAIESVYPPLREQSTTRGVFDENGGTLCDTVWNVSINIPKGAIPSGIRQEIYFTVTDPRMSQSVVGPPLDMENGWCCFEKKNPCFI